MSHRNLKTVLALALITGAAFAPAAQAADINRNTGVGYEIAAQGNVALRAIQAAIRVVMPTLPKPAAHATRVSAPVESGGNGAALTTAAVRCAE